MDKKEKKDLPVAPMFPPLGVPVVPVRNVVADPMGSYTGTPADPEELPVQDADDL